MISTFSINVLDETIEHQTKELNALEEKCADLSAQIDSQTKLETERETLR
jgi:phage-related tail protein